MANAALVVGASGGLGRAVVAELSAHEGIEVVVAVSRRSYPVDVDALKVEVESAEVKWLSCVYTDEGIVDAVSKIKAMGLRFGKVAICNGILHSDVIQPEKRLEELSISSMVDVFQANTAIPAAWVKALLSVLKGKEPCVLAAFSARVGSIGDNRLGGWYSYRSSKSALNMFLKTAAIEYGRRAKNVKLIAFHPGTTDTALSKPFQQSVPEGKLFTPQFVAAKLLKVMDSVSVDGELSYLDWDNQPIAW